MIDWIKKYKLSELAVYWCLFAIASVMMFAKLILFHWACFHSLLVSSIFTQTEMTVNFYLSKLMTAIFISSILFVIKRKWIFIMLQVLADLWIIANIFYFRANELFISVEAIGMIGNLDGFWSAILTYFSWEIYVIPFLTVLFAILYYLMPDLEKRRWMPFASLYGVFILFLNYQYLRVWQKDYKRVVSSVEFYEANGETDTAWGPDHLYGKYGEKCFIPFHKAYAAAKCKESFQKYYIRERNILDYFPAMVIYYLADEEKTIRPVDSNEVAPFINYTSDSIVCEGDVVFILIESLESWPLLLDNYAEHIAPNLYHFVNENDHVLFCTQMTSQVKHGVSGDGQMLLNSGLLPINTGAACYLYGDNEWPNIASHYEHSILINPCADNTWNQRQMTIKYGYQQELYPEKSWSDYDIFNVLGQVLDTIQSPFVVHAITLEMHSPFEIGRNIDITDMPEGMPKYLHDYLGALHYTDSCFGLFYTRFKEDERLQNATIVITGDHTIFKSSMLYGFQDYAERNQLDIPQNQSYTPFIVYSPTIKHKIVSNDICYQMDMYPTLCHMLGLDTYYWKGFGVNLLDSAETANRYVEESILYDLSDRIIRSNYFLNYRDSLGDE